MPWFWHSLIPFSVSLVSKYPWANYYVFHLPPLFPVSLPGFLADPLSVPSETLIKICHYIGCDWEAALMKRLLSVQRFHLLSSFKCLRWIPHASNNFVFSVGKLVTKEKKYWIKMCFSLLWIQVLHYWRGWEFCQ